MKLKFRPVSFLKPQNINKNQNNQTTNPIKYQYNLSSDTISFSGKSLVQQVKDLEKDAFLSDGLREYILSNIDNENNLVDLHKEYYASLLNCKTLDEAKELYPEFSNVVDLKDVDLSSISFYALKQIAKGQIEGLNKENASLVFLKKYIGELTPFKSGCNEDYFYLSYQTIKKILKFLNISMDSDYDSILRKYRMSKSRLKIWQDDSYRTKTVNSMNASDFRKQRSKIMQDMWQDEEFREKVVSAMNSPEAKTRRSISAKARWQDEEARLKQSEISKKQWQSEEMRLKQSKISKEKWQDDEFRAKVLKGLNSPEAKTHREQTIRKRHQKNIQELKGRIVLTAKKIAYVQCLKKAKNIKEILEKFPHIRKVLSLKSSNLTTERMIRANIYFIEVNKEYPKLAEEVEKAQKQILFDLGFYDDDCDLNKILKKALNFFE